MAGTNNNNDTIDLSTFFRKVAAKWYYFVFTLLLFGALAVVYTQFAEKEYAVAASIYVKGANVGSVETGELLSPGADKRGFDAVALTNEMGKLKSYTLVKSALENLNYEISYYNVESFWPNFMRESWLNEVGNYAPYVVTLDSSANQLMNTPIFLSPVSDNEVRIYAKDSETSTYNFSSNSGARLEDFKIDEIVTLGEPFTSPYINLTVEKKSDAPVATDFDYAFKIVRLEDLAMQYQGRLTVEPLNVMDAQNRMLKLGIQETLPEKGIQFLSTLIEVYGSENLSSKNARGQNSVEFLNKEITQTRDSLNKAQTALQNFKSSSGIVSIGSSQDVAVGSLSSLQQEKAMTEKKLNYYRNTLKSLKNSAANTLVAPSTGGLNENPLFNKLVEQYIEIITRLNELKYSAQPGNPLVRQLETQATTVREALVQNLTESINVEEVNLKSINGRISSLKYDISAMPNEERELSILQREYDNLAAKLTQLIDKRGEAELLLATNADNVEVVDAPKKVGYKPVAPNNTLIYTIAIVLALMIPLTLILAQDVANNNIRDKKELEMQSKAPLLGMIANGPKDAKLITHKYPNSAIAESFKFARINLQYFHQNSHDKVIGMTSSISGEGKTFCSANLSAAFAESGKRTILVCCDLRKPKIQEYFNLRGPGISEYVSEFVSMDDIIQPTDIRNLDVISPGMPQEDPIHMFESARMEELMEELKKRYDNIVVETPPIGYVADYFVLLKYFDINLFVVRYNYTNKNILSGINDLYSNNKIKNLYLLFNDVRFSAEYGYGYLSNSDGYYTNTYVRKLNGKKGQLKNPFAS